MKWYLRVMKENYLNFRGRARRKEFWMWFLFFCIFIIISSFLDGLLGIDFIETSSAAEGVVWLIVCIAHLIPGIAVIVRRIHDAGKSEWYLLISLVPKVGLIWLLYILCSNGDSGDNAYGPNPKKD